VEFCACDGERTKEVSRREREPSNHATCMMCMHKCKHTCTPNISYV
jgi:hypothetical protein